MKTIKLQSLKLFLFASLAMAGGLLPTAAWATPTLFNVNGTCTAYVSITGPCVFSGKLGVDTSNGTLLSMDFRFPGDVDFNQVQNSESSGGGWVLQTTNLSSGDSLSVDFSTTNAGTLRGFDGGTITGVSVLSGSEAILFFGLGPSGSITPAAIGVPEPAELGMFGLGLLLIGVFTSRRRRTH